MLNLKMLDILYDAWKNNEIFKFDWSWVDENV